MYVKLFVIPAPLFTRTYVNHTATFREGIKNDNYIFHRRIKMIPRTFTQKTLLFFK